MLKIVLFQTINGVFNAPVYYAWVKNQISWAYKINCLDIIND